MKKILLFMFSISIYINVVIAQTGIPLKLRSGMMIPPNNVETFINGQQPTDVFNGYYYRYLQFNTIPTTSQKQQINNTGIILLSYIPNNAFMAAIPVGYNRSLLSSFNIASIIQPNPIQKINQKLIGEIPAYAVKEKGTIDLDVQHYANILTSVVIGEATKLGKVLFYNPTNKTITMRIKDDQRLNLASLSWVSFVTMVSPASTPDDTRGKSLHRSNVINSEYAGGLHYDGTGVTAGLADDGFVGPHIDFKGRLINFATATGGTHGDMTSGILAGTGNLDPTIKGMASGVQLYAYDIGGPSSTGADYPHIRDAVSNFTTLGTTITSTSYSQGCNDYTTDTQLGDQLIHENEQFEFVFSAGNNNSGDCGYGAGAGWGNITGGFKQGKNIIACGNLDALEVIDPSSSFGPASDGRIKPDICANGRGQLSTNENNTYQVGGGTSAACPSTAGVFAQITQAYKDLNGGVQAPTALIKAAILNSAEDIGNAGPDFKYGWGRVNARRAVSVLQDNRYFTDSISQGITKTNTISVPAGTLQMRVMIYWHDVEGSPISSQYLVNDIDFTVTDPSTTIFTPWVLDPTPNAINLAAPAIRGIDHINNVEQVTIDNPAAGNYTININGFAIPSGPQQYYVVYEFRTNEITLTYPQGGEGFASGETEVIRWDAVKSSTPFLLEYSTNAGTSWTNIASVAGNTLQYQWTVPNTVSGAALVRVSQGLVSDVSDTSFAIIGVPQNISIDFACPDSIRLVWNPVNGATGYTIYQLGTKYMTNVGTSTTNSFILSPYNPLIETWFSVSAITPDGLNGRRANAIIKTPGVFSCPLSLDASIKEIQSPGSGIITDCADNSQTAIKVVIENRGINPLSNISISYSLNGGPIITETLAGPLASLASQLYTFTSTVNLTNLGTYDLLVWVNYPGDLNVYNDTIAVQTTVIAGTIVTAPLIENLETFALCGTSSDCGATNCNLLNGWNNEVNGQSDDIDFRTSQGPTISVNTGPDFDHTTGTANGKYIYLEASGTCNGQVAIMSSPCIDLTNAVGPQLTFWYHMYGAGMGSLRVDVFADGAWINAAWPSVSGDQGNQWLQGTLSLNTWIGKIISVRFVGTTGTSFESDIALDDIGIFETNAAPIAQFTANSTNNCINSTIQLTDQSANSPTSWLWSFSPSTVTFVNGTSATSQNPQVQFSANGNYTVTLAATNSFGTNSSTQNNFISIGNSAIIPIVEPFTVGIFPPTNWSIQSSLGAYTWEESATITGADGNPTVSAYFNNFAYNNVGVEDGLVTPSIDLGTVSNPVVRFDVAHARYDSTFIDGLRVDVSTDCGTTFTPTGYLKTGLDLATAPDQNTIFTPIAAANWRNDLVDLSNWAGQEVILKFVNIAGYGNSVFIDNINVESYVGINEADVLDNINIYPNPSSGLFIINMKNSTNDNLLFNVTDMQGRVILNDLEKSNTIQSKTIDLSSQNKGMYILTIKSKNKQQSFKLTLL